MISRLNVAIAALFLVVAACAADDADTEKGDTQELASATPKGHSAKTTGAHAPVKAEGHAKGMHGKHGKHGGWSHEAHAKKLQEKLGLTDEQATKVKAAFASDSDAPMAERLKPILTAAQMVKLQALKAKHGGGDCKHGGGDCKHGGGDCKHGGGDCKHGGGDCKHGGGDCKHGGGDCKHGGGDCKHGGGDKHGSWSHEAHAKKLQDKLGLTDEQTVKVKAAFASDAKTPMQDRLKPILSADQYVEWQRIMKAHGKHGKKHGMHGKKHGMHGMHGKKHGMHGKKHGMHGKKHGMHGAKSKTQTQ